MQPFTASIHPMQATSRDLFGPPAPSLLVDDPALEGCSEEAYLGDGGSDLKPGLLRRLFAGKGVNDSPERMRRARLLSLATIVFAAFALAFAVVELVISGGLSMRLALAAGASVLTLVVPILVRVTGSTRVAGTALVALMLLTVALISFTHRGIWDEAFLVNLVIPWVAAGLIAPAAAPVAAAVVVLEVLIGLFVSSGTPLLFNAAAPDGFLLRWALVFISVSLYVGVGGYYVERMTIARLRRSRSQLGHVREMASRNEMLFRSLVQHTSDLLTLIREDSVIFFQSPSSRPLLGFEPDEMIGSAVLDFVHPDDRPEIGRWLSRLLSEHRDEERPFSAPVFRALNKKGGFIWAESTVLDLRKDPIIRGLIIHTRDVGMRKTAEDELVRARDEAERMVRMRTAFLANMSHDIRTPLTSITGFANILAEEIEGEHKEFAELIGRAGRRLLTTLNAVLDMAQSEAGALKPRWVVADLSREIREAVAILSPLALEKGITLHADTPGPLWAPVDVAFFHRILNNLVGNAIKYTYEGGVTMELFDEGANVHLKVIDTGPGMSESFQRQLFQEYQRERTSFLHASDGVGLGLAITQRLVHLMNGEVGVESAPGSGTVFHIRLPKTREEEAV